MADTQTASSRGSDENRPPTPRTNRSRTSLRDDSDGDDPAGNGDAGSATQNGVASTATGSTASGSTSTTSTSTTSAASAASASSSSSGASEEGDEGADDSRRNHAKLYQMGAQGEWIDREVGFVVCERNQGGEDMLVLRSDEEPDRTLLVAPLHDEIYTLTKRKQCRGVVCACVQGRWGGLTCCRVCVRREHHHLHTASD